MSSRRELILETIRLTLASIVSGQPLSDPYPYTFSSVVRGPLPEKAGTKRLVGAVSPLEEAKDRVPQFTRCELQVSVDFLFTVNKGDANPGIEVEKIITTIQRALLGVYTLNGLAIDMQEIGSSVDMSSSIDKTVEGTVFFMVQYRHDLADPRTYLGSTAPAASVALV